jgi:hypothetical protein
MGSGGFLNSAYRPNSVSDFIGADAGFVGGRTILEKAQTHVLFGDRNIRYDGRGSCSVGLNNIWQLNTRPMQSGEWTNSIHMKRGNLAIGDGSVAQTTCSAFTNLMMQGDDNGSVHVLTH